MKITIQDDHTSDVIHLPIPFDFFEYLDVTIFYLILLVNIHQMAAQTR